MDRVRFGRALGLGTRHALKTLVSAVDAATADNPVAGKTAPNQASRPARSSSVAKDFAAHTPARATPFNSDTSAHKAAPSSARAAETQTRKAKQHPGRGSKRFGAAMLEPFVRLSGVLWLEVTGVFFGLFALVALGHLWKLRAAWHADAADTASRHSLFGAAIMFALFGYFCVSSFIRARRRERKR